MSPQERGEAEYHRIIRLLSMIDGRRKFPLLFTQPKWERQ